MLILQLATPGNMGVMNCPVGDLLPQIALGLVCLSVYPVLNFV